MKTTLPKSKAKTAYGLLSEVRRLILAEPKRYDQYSCLIRGRGLADVEKENRPACGTIGCVAGWVGVLKAPHSRDPFMKAFTILGLEPAQCTELANGSAAGSRADIGEHARRGADHIAAFQRKYAAQLKAKKLK